VPCEFATRKADGGGALAHGAEIDIEGGGPVERAEGADAVTEAGRVLGFEVGNDMLPIGRDQFRAGASGTLAFHREPREGREEDLAAPGSQVEQVQIELKYRAHRNGASVKIRRA
jgi:hypothetical protein